MDWRPQVHWQTLSGEPVTVGGVTVTPQSRALIVQWPYRIGGLVWNRPLAVWVQRGGQTRRIPVVDVTRRAQIALFGLALVFGLTTLVLKARQGRKSHA